MQSFWARMEFGMHVDKEFAHQAGGVILHTGQKNGMFEVLRQAGPIQPALGPNQRDALGVVHVWGKTDQG